MSETKHSEGPKKTQAEPPSTPAAIIARWPFLEDDDEAPDEPLSNNQAGLVGRDEDNGGLHRRAVADLCVTAAVSHREFNDPTATVQVFRSAEDMDRAGVVLRIALRFDDGYGWMPWARVTDDGVEVHIAGEAEARAVMDALRVALSLPENGRTRVENRNGAPR